MITPRALLHQTAQTWRLNLHSAQLDAFDRYAAELVQWNAHTNLTAITTPDQIVTRHFLDSLALARVWPDTPPTSLADVGTGAGFPGLPLKLLWPDLKLLLIESVGKKAAFLQHIVNVLKLTNVEIVTLRAEEAGHDPRLREQYVAVTARAVATLNVLAEYCLPLCRVGGVFVAPKSSDGALEAAQASRAFAQLGGTLRDVIRVQLPQTEERTLVVVEKTMPTPGQFPRRTGVPTKRPL